MPEIHDLNPADASNTVRFPENQAPSTLNNGARALEGLIARYFFDNDSSVLATLSGSLITIVANRNSLTLTGTTSNYVANFMQAFTMGANPNTGPVRATIDGVGPISIRDNRGASLSSSILLAGTRALIVKDATNDYFRLVWPHSQTDTDPITTRGDLIRGSSAGAAERLALGSARQVMTSDGTDAAWGTPPPTLGTPQASTSGTEIDFTGIPAGVRRVTINLDGVSLSGTADLLIQLGDSGGFETTGYVSSSIIQAASASNSAAVTSTSGLALSLGAAAQTITGRVVLEMINASTNTWIATATGFFTSNNIVHAAGDKSLSAELTQVRITTTNGTDTFDAGAINITYE